MNNASCLINQTSCGRVAGNPVCPKCGMDERVVYPGQADREAAQAAALARYVACEEAATRPSEPQSPLPASHQPMPESQPANSPEPTPPAVQATPNKGSKLGATAVLVVVLLGGGFWWKAMQNERVLVAEERAMQEAAKVRSERAAEKLPADEAETASIRVVQQEREPAQADQQQVRTAPVESAPPVLLEGRYQLLANGSEIRDMQTGLTWARCSVGQTWDGNTCFGYPRSFTFKDLQKLSGDGWRVPSVRELASLIFCDAGPVRHRFNPGDGGKLVGYGCIGDFTRPTLKTDVFPHTHSDMSLGNEYWTSSPHNNDVHSAWSVNFGDGGVYGTGRAVNLRVQMVRSSN